MEFFTTNNESKTFETLLAEHRQLESSLTAALKRHRAEHGIEAVVQISSDFSPDSDFGLLVIWGKLTIQKGSKVDPSVRLLLAKAAYLREERRLLLAMKAPPKGKTTKEKKKTKKSDVDEDIFDQLAAKKKKLAALEDIQNVRTASPRAPRAPCSGTEAQPCTTDTTVQNSQRLLQDDELECIFQRYAMQYRGVSLTQVSPVYDPSTDLGQLIRAGWLLRPVAMRIAPHHQEALDREWQLRQPDVQQAQQREAWLLLPTASLGCAPAPVMAPVYSTACAAVNPIPTTQQNSFPALSSSSPWNNGAFGGPCLLQQSPLTEENQHPGVKIHYRFEIIKDPLIGTSTPAFTAPLSPMAAPAIPAEFPAQDALLPGPGRTAHDATPSLIDGACNTTCTTSTDHNITTAGVVRKRKDRGNKSSSSSKRKKATEGEKEDGAAAVTATTGDNSSAGGDGRAARGNCDGCVDSYKQDFMSRLLGLS